LQIRVSLIPLLCCQAARTHQRNSVCYAVSFGITVEGGDAPQLGR